MDGGLSGYLVVLGAGIALTVVIGQILVRSGTSMLAADGGEADSRGAESTSRMIGVLFHLVALGVLALVAGVDVGAESTVQTVVTKIGVVLLVLGGITAVAIGVLGAIRGRRAARRLVEAAWADEPRRASRP